MVALLCANASVHNKYKRWMNGENQGRIYDSNYCAQPNTKERKTATYKICGTASTKYGDAVKVQLSHEYA